MKYAVTLFDDNGNAFEYRTCDWAAVLTLTLIVKAATTTEGFERFATDSALVVKDESGNEVARGDKASGWALQNPER